VNAPLSSSGAFTGVERAAVLMMLVGEEEAAAILQKLDPDEVRALGAAMIAVADVSEEQMADVLDDFVGRARTRTGVQFDPKPQVEAVMTRALGPSRAEAVLARIVPQDTGGELDALQWLDPADIARIVEGEHPQIGAVLIANCDPSVAGQVLELLPDAIQPDLLHRVAKLGPVAPEAIATLKAVLAAHGGRRTAPGLTLGGTREAARILQGARKATEARVMPKLFKLDKDVARQIEEAMFVFDNLLEMDDKNLGTMIRNVDGEVLVKALKGVDEAVRDRFLGCMSARAADGIRDEMEGRGPMKLAEVLDAQKAMIATARQLAKDGTIQIGAGEDDYV